MSIRTFGAIGMQSSYACPAVSRSPAVPVVLLLALAALAVAGGFWGVTYDDGYITYRYADRLASGRGLTWNDDARVLGTSAPGYALLLAAFARAGAGAGFDVADAGSLATFGSLVLLAALAAAPGRGGVAVPVLFGALALVSRFDLELQGCETLPAAAALACAFRLALLDERPAAAGLAGAVATAMRADSALALAVIGCLLWHRRRAFPARFALAAGVPVAAGLAALALYFGSPVPATLAGKRAELALAATGYGRAQWDWLERIYGPGGALALVGLAVAGLLLSRERLARARPALAAAALWLVLHESFYRLVGVPFSPWYHVHLFHALLAAAALGAWRLAELLLARVRAAPGPAARAALAAALALPLALPSLEFAVAGWGEPPDPRVRIYRDVARAADACPGEGAIVAVEIGALGYFSRRPVADLVGLVDPELRAARVAGRQAETAFARRPDFVVDHPVFRDPYLGPVLAAAAAGGFRPLGTFTRPEYPTAVRLWGRAGACAPGRRAGS